jgi:KUP system potassium uptake protein
MTAVATAEENVAENKVGRATTPTAALAALGIVYGDLGTSPLYTMQTIVGAVGGHFSPDAALGVFSLIFWSLAITVSIKYCVFVMRADNHGEGGILALMSLLGRTKRVHLLILMGLFGAALIYGDGIITPAISVLSALEGVNVATTALKPFILPIAVGILFALFALQAKGTGQIGKIFGPIMLTWFMVVALLGIGGIVRHPGVLAAVNPAYAGAFLVHHGLGSFAVLGGVFLALTGGEALYADMGHIGRNPIRMSWYCIVLPALLLNYAGQTAALLDNPDPKGNPFFTLAPAWSIYPLVVLATAATIIASQAIITGSFSLTRQATQLGWFPGLRIFQTSSEEYGQIYVPFVNWAMMIATIALTVSFGSSDKLAGAYGTAVSTTMLLTTALLYSVMRSRWQWPMPLALAVAGIFPIVDLAFFSANLMKIADGGWIPLLFGAAIFLTMTTWHAGVEAVRAKLVAESEPGDRFLAHIRDEKIVRVAGTSVFLTRTQDDIPPQIVRYLAQTGVLHKTVLVMTVLFDDIPRVGSEGRVVVQKLAEGFWRVTVRYGFVEIPDLPAALGQAKELGCPVDLDHALYFGSRDEIVRGKRKSSLARWRRPLFAFMYRNAVRPVDVFNLRPDSFLNIGRQIEL